VSETEQRQPEHGGPWTCEDVTFGGKVCGMPAPYLVAYNGGGGDSTPMCLPHVCLELEAAKNDSVQQQEWTITYT
jgi:hypothetical protein